MNDTLSTTEALLFSILATVTTAALIISVALN